MNLDEQLDNMSEDELLDLAVQLYEEAKAKVAAGEGDQKLIQASNDLRKALDNITNKQEKH